MPVSIQPKPHLKPTPLTLYRHIAWSKWGSIASIAPNGTSLELRNLACDPADGTWALTEPTITTSASPALEGGPFRHVSWSPTGSELAVIDSVGRVTILAIFSTLNKSELKRPAQFDPVDDLHRIIGTFWLHIPGYSGNRTVSVFKYVNVRRRLIMSRRFSMVRQ